MNKTHTLIIFIMGALVGSAPFLLKQCLAPDIVATGILKSHNSHGAPTADFPAGYYVESRVYVDNIDTDLLGQIITVEGDIESINGSDHIWHYPLIINAKDRTKVK